MTQAPSSPPSRADALASLLGFWADAGVLDPADAAAILRRNARASREPRTDSAAGSDPRAPQSPNHPLGREGQKPPRPPPRKLSRNPVEEARKAAAAAATIEALRETIDRFEGCPLKPGARRTVVSDGALDAPVMLVGEAPGAEEDAKGLPFVGRAGQLLDRMLASIGLSRSVNVYITNTVYWRPPGNRDPTPEEIAICSPFLQRQIELKKPKLLLTAGKPATQSLLRTEEGIMRLAGRRTRYIQAGMADSIPCIPLLHPSYLLRRSADKAKAWRHLMAVAALCDELGVKRDGAL
ncbi:MAG: uracil-DNA glycosylase [Hyphomonadaceae bacterium]